MKIALMETATVKVMRSHDYCHFEICLGISSPNTPQEVDELRKAAARLADKAVEQYKIAKRHREKREAINRSYEEIEAKHILSISKTDRTAEQKAKLKGYEDAVFLANRGYDYEDDWQDDHP